MFKKTEIHFYETVKICLPLKEKDGLESYIRMLLHTRHGDLCRYFAVTPVVSKINWLREGESILTYSCKGWQSQ